jgi:DNA primase
VAEYILDELPDESLIDNKDIQQLISLCKESLQNKSLAADRNFFIYHPDSRLSALAVSLLNTPYEESEHWRREFSPASGYQKRLFEKSYDDFIQTVSRNNSEELLSYLNIADDNTMEAVESSIHYLKLRKIRRMLLENQLDIEKPHTEEEYSVLHQTHLHLKNMEIELTKKSGTVIMR